MNTKTLVHMIHELGYPGILSWQTVERGEDPSRHPQLSLHSGNQVHQISKKENKNITNHLEQSLLTNKTKDPNSTTSPPYYLLSKCMS